MAITSPLLDDISVEGATGVLINIVGGPDMKMKEIQEAATLVQEQAHEDANIIFGASIDETMGDAIKVTVIATGFDTSAEAIPVDVVHETGRRPVQRATARESVSPVATSRLHCAPRAPPGRGAGDQPAPFRRVRREPAGLRAAAVHRMPAVRERITFPSTPDATGTCPRSSAAKTADRRRRIPSLPVCRTAPRRPAWGGSLFGDCRLSLVETNSRSPRPSAPR